MSNSSSTRATVLRSRILNSLRLAAHPLDVLGVARVNGYSPDDCEAELQHLVQEGIVQRLDPLASKHEQPCRYELPTT